MQRPQLRLVTMVAPISTEDLRWLALTLRNVGPLLMLVWLWRERKLILDLLDEVISKRG